MSPQEFLHHTKSECAALGVTCLFPHTARVPYSDSGSMQVSGYFADVPTPTLACALGKPEGEWLKILVHESCHMDQWREHDPLWSDQYTHEVACDEGMDQWLGGKDFPEGDYTYFIRTMQALEAGCERRALEKITAYALPIEPTHYAKDANAYLFFYSVLLKTRQWYETAPYEVAEIIEKMPAHILPIQAYASVPESLLTLYTTHCYQKAPAARR